LFVGVIKRCSMADSATDIVLDLIKGSWLAHNRVLKPSIWNWKLSFSIRTHPKKIYIHAHLVACLRSRRGHIYLFMFKIDM